MRNETGTTKAPTASLATAPQSAGEGSPPGVGAVVSRQEFEALEAVVAKLAAQVARMAAALPVPEQHLAIMAAVFAQYLGRPVRVRSARRVGTPSSSWSQEGRSSLHSQRHVRRA